MLNAENLRIPHSERSDARWVSGRKNFGEIPNEVFVCRHGQGLPGVLPRIRDYLRCNFSDVIDPDHLLFAGRIQWRDKFSFPDAIGYLGEKTILIKGRGS